MTIFTRDLTRQIKTFVLLPLFLFRLVPYVTCQQDSDSSKIDTESVIGILMLSFFLFAMVSCCLFYAIQGFQIEAAGGGHEVVLQSRARRGLDKDAIESFPSFLYSEVKEFKIGKGGLECAICLNEFEDEETLRWMPPCSHTFHANCVDVWLSSHPTCPVCRTNVSLEPGDRFPDPRMDLEAGNAQRGNLDSPIGDNNNNANCTTPRSRSTGLLSRMRIAEILIPRSKTTGHSMVQVSGNLDRFTLQLPEEVQRQLFSMNMMRRSRHVALPRASSSRQGYRSGSVGREKINFSQGRQTLKRAMSLSMSLSFQPASVRSTHGRDDLVQESPQAKDNGYGERSFERLMP